MNSLEKVADGLDWIIEHIARVTAWSALALVAIMAFNVLLRYFFRTGSVAMQEMEWHLMAVLALLCISYSTLKDGHVQVDVLYRQFPPRVQRIIHFISCLLILAVAIIIFRLSIPYVTQSYNIGERSPDPGGLGQRWIIKAMIPAGFALLFVQSFAALLRALVSMLTGRQLATRDDRGAEHAA
mgnify:CR=1 FL=1